MKRVTFSICLFVMLGISACLEKQSKLNSYIEAEQDTLLKRFVFKEFHLEKRKNKDSDVNQRITDNRDNNEIIVYPGPYKLKYYNLGDAFGYSPFAVKITTLKDRLISFFTFTDEMYYLNNPISGHYDDKYSIVFKERNEKTGFVEERNFEKNLNELIHKLGYEKNQRAIINLTDAMFHLLNMHYVSECLIEDLSTKLDQVKSNEKLISDCKGEFREFSKYLSGCRILCGVSGHEGVYGFWQLSLEQNGEIYCVRTKFIGDLIFTGFYI